jgi:hypothetical protein
MIKPRTICGRPDHNPKRQPPLRSTLASWPMRCAPLHLCIASHQRPAHRRCRRCCCYCDLLRVEDLFNRAKVCYDSTILHPYDAAIRSHVSCSLLALLLRPEMWP